MTEVEPGVEIDEEVFEPGESHGTVIRLSLTAALGGAAAGALGAGRVADRYGRLPAMRVAAVLFLIGAVGSGLAGSLVILVVFRGIGGVAVGIASVIAPTYIAE